MVLLVFIGAQVLGRLVRMVFKVLFLGWIDNLGGAALGTFGGFLVGAAIVAILARLTFLVPDGLGPVEVRNNLKTSLPGSAVAGVLGGVSTV